MKTVEDIIICDDHYICAIGVEVLLKNILSKNIHIRFASDARDVQRLFQEREPDLLILDLGLPDKSGLEILKDLALSVKECAVFVMTASEDPILLQQVLKQEIRALLKKSNSRENLMCAIHFLQEEKVGIYIDPAFSAFLTNSFEIPISPREFDVLELMSQGYTSQEIAERISCSLSTIKTYRMRIMNKIGARNSSEMIAWFLKGRG